ncbi:MAG: hypothetical protein IKY61_06865 [Thermoguttaceae bacterium]|nr:hypothetical protein [Thermoguttaceae bacterium]
MNDFEVLSRDGGEPVEPKRDAETPVESETVRRVRVGLDALTAELAEAKEAVAYLEARENELLAEKAELARSLDDCRIISDVREGAFNDMQARYAEYREEDLKIKRELRREVADAQLIAERFQTALDAALDDVATYRRAAFWFAVSSVVGVVALIRVALFASH